MNLAMALWSRFANWKWGVRGEWHCNYEQEARRKVSFLVRTTLPVYITKMRQHIECNDGLVIDEHKAVGRNVVFDKFERNKQQDSPEDNDVQLGNDLKLSACDTVTSSKKPGTTMASIITSSNIVPSIVPSPKLSVPDTVWYCKLHQWLMHLRLWLVLCGDNE